MKTLCSLESTKQLFLAMGRALGNYHPERSMTYAEDVAYRAVPSLGLPPTPGPFVLLKIQCFSFHFRQFKSKQIVSKDIKSCFQASK